MFATGPYAHETQLVSPPVFSTFTTEPSTAPLTPPPELAHLTTPSSPDVPFARFLTSSADLKTADKNNYSDLHSTYSLYPGSPASSLRSPISRTSGDCLSSSFTEREFPPQWYPSISPQNGKHSRSGSGRLFGHDVTSSPIGSQDTNFFCPATFAEFYLDPNSVPHAGGRLSVSKDSDVYPSSCSGHQNRQSKSPKQDVEELEAYRASFGFSADEIITTPQYVELPLDSFTMTPFTTDKPAFEESVELAPIGEGPKTDRIRENLLDEKKQKSKPDDLQVSSNGYEDHKLRRQMTDVSGFNHILTDEEDVLLKKSSSRSRKYHLGLSSSDAEIDYRRGRSLREGRGP
ncbi:hypothetical protein PTKIN_Ptkin13bG0028600 [Pterospermum kingtungense]